MKEKLITFKNEIEQILNTPTDYDYEKDEYTCIIKIQEILDQYSDIIQSFQLKKIIAYDNWEIEYPIIMIAFTTSIAGLETYLKEMRVN